METNVLGKYETEQSDMWPTKSVNPIASAKDTPIGY